MVMGGDSYSEGRGFESQHCVLDGHKKCIQFSPVLLLVTFFAFNFALTFLLFYKQTQLFRKLISLAERPNCDTIQLAN